MTPPFTVVVCTGCGAAEMAVLEALRAVVRRCRHGILVSAPCLLGPQVCQTRHGQGAVVMLQPCWPDRSPVGPAQWIGPITDSAELAELCDWIASGEWAGALPSAPRAGKR